MITSINVRRKKYITCLVVVNVQSASHEFAIIHNQQCWYFSITIRFKSVVFVRRVMESEKNFTGTIIVLGGDSCYQCVLFCLDLCRTTKDQSPLLRPSLTPDPNPKIEAACDHWCCRSTRWLCFRIIMEHSEWGEPHLLWSRPSCLSANRLSMCWMKLCLMFQ
jgi:hypothetical protein